MDNPLGKNQGWQAEEVLPFSFLMVFNNRIKKRPEKVNSIVHNMTLRNANNYYK